MGPSPDSAEPTRRRDQAAAPSPGGSESRRVRLRRWRVQAEPRPDVGAKATGRRHRVPAVMIQATPGPGSAETRCKRRVQAEPIDSGDANLKSGGTESRRRLVPAVPNPIGAKSRVIAPSSPSPDATQAAPSPGGDEMRCECRVQVQRR